MKNLFFTAAVIAASFTASAQCEQWQDEAIYWKNLYQQEQATSDSLQGVLDNQDVVMTHEEFQGLVLDIDSTAQAVGYQAGYDNAMDECAENIYYAHDQAYSEGYNEGLNDCGETSGMTTVSPTGKTPAAYYDLTGRQINPNGYTGTVIVKYTDGSTSKTFVSQ